MLSGSGPTQYQRTNRAVHYRPRIKYQKTARSAVGVEPTTFRTAVMTMTIKTSAFTETATTGCLESTDTVLPQKKQSCLKSNDAAVDCSLLYGIRGKSAFSLPTFSNRRVLLAATILNFNRCWK